MMTARKPITPGEKFGRLTIICEVERRPTRPQRRVTARCECGAVKDYDASRLWTGHTTSCGCFALETRTAHGHAPKRAPLYRTYQTWRSIHNRCHPEKGHRDYAGRGIRVCDRWESFDNFFADMGQKPEGMSIDRIDVNGNYEPSNCRWATSRQQANNRTNSHFIEAFGRRMTVMEWSRETGIPFPTIRCRLDRGWSGERAVSTPSDLRHSRRNSSPST